MTISYSARKDIAETALAAMRLYHPGDVSSGITIMRMVKRGIILGDDGSKVQEPLLDRQWYDILRMAANRQLRLDWTFLLDNSK